MINNNNVAYNTRLMLDTIKGYRVEILGNDDNKIIVRPDLSLNMVIKLIGGNTNE